MRGKHFVTNLPTKLLIFVRQTIENLIRGLDDDEVDFLSIVDKAKMDAERRQQNEDNKEMREFRERVATLQENTIDQVCVGVIYRIYAWRQDLSYQNIYW